VHDGAPASVGPAPSVVELSAGETHDLRRRVLRPDSPQEAMAWDIDRRPRVVHLGLRRGAGIMAVATLAPAAAPSEVERAVDDRGARRDPWQLRGMAVDPTEQGGGLGRLLLGAVVTRARAEGATLLWANGRDSTEHFYRRAGWTVLGDGFVTDFGVAHHTIVLDLRAGREPLDRPPAGPPPGT